MTPDDFKQLLAAINTVAKNLDAIGWILLVLTLVQCTRT